MSELLLLLFKRQSESNSLCHQEMYSRAFGNATVILGVIGLRNKHCHGESFSSDSEMRLDTQPLVAEPTNFSTRIVSVAQW